MGIFLFTGCGGGTYRAPGVRAGVQLPGDSRPAGRGAIFASWIRDLAPDSDGRYVPVERAGVVADEGRDRVYAVSSFGVLWTFTGAGKRLARRPIGAAVEAPPLLDSVANRLYVVAVTGEVHALSAATGEAVWTAHAGGPVSTAMVASDDALYIVTDDDSVVAMDQSTGEVLWRYRHEALSELSVSGHAGMLVVGNRLYTGMTDGLVVALDVGDGREIWHVDTSLDVARETRSTDLVDVDTTPVIVDGKLLVASFSAGLYVLDAKRGAVIKRHEEHTSVVGLTPVQQGLLVASADEGLTCLDSVSMKTRWRRKGHTFRGSATQAVVNGNHVYMGESRGAFLVLDVADGSELSRIESAHGFESTPTLKGGRGFVLSNTARLIAFRH